MWKYVHKALRAHANRTTDILCSMRDPRGRKQQAHIHFGAEYTGRDLRLQLLPNNDTAN